MEGKAVKLPNMPELNEIDQQEHPTPPSTDNADIERVREELQRARTKASLLQKEINLIEAQLSKEKPKGRISSKKDIRLEEAKLKFPMKMQKKLTTLEEHLRENPDSGPKPRRIIEQPKTNQERPFKAKQRGGRKFQRRRNLARAGQLARYLPEEERNNLEKIIKKTAKDTISEKESKEEIDNRFRKLFRLGEEALARVQEIS